MKTLALLALLQTATPTPAPPVVPEAPCPRLKLTFITDGETPFRTAPGGVFKNIRMEQWQDDRLHLQGQDGIGEWWTVGTWSPLAHKGEWVLVGSSGGFERIEVGIEVTCVVTKVRPR